MSSLGALEPYRIEPYRKNAVLAAIATFDAPFTFSEIVERTGLPRMIVTRVVLRLVKSGFLTRHKVPMAHGTLWRGGRRKESGGSKLTYLYRVASWEA